MKKTKLVASVQSPAKPFFVQTGRTASGFNVDFLALLTKQPEFRHVTAIDYRQFGSYEDVPKQLLSNKEIDIAIDGLTFNDEDLPGVVYSAPYVKDFGYSLIVKNGVRVNSNSDLDGQTIGIIQGDPDVRSVVEQSFPKSKIVELSDKVDDTGKWMTRYFAAGKVDAIVFDYPFAVEEISGTNLQFAMTKIKGSDIQYRIGVRKENQHLLSALNVAIQRVVQTDEYTDLLKKYFVSTNVASVRRASSGETSYVVVKGDTLSTIAQTMLGDKMKFGEIQQRNNIPNPNLISVGQKLIIPQKAQ